MVSLLVLSWLGADEVLFQNLVWRATSWLASQPLRFCAQALLLSASVCGGLAERGRPAQRPCCLQKMGEEWTVWTTMRPKLKK